MRPDVLHIEDSDELYRRIFRGHFYPNGKVMSAAFKLKSAPDNSISVDLAHQTTPEQTLERGRKAAQEYGLGLIMAGFPRSLQLEVRHAPTYGNYAHSLIEGENTMMKCQLLAEHTQVIRRPAESRTD